MFDDHLLPNQSWGIRPILFTINEFPIPSYATFMLLGLMAGLFVYFVTAKRSQVFSHNSSVILLAGLISGTLGAKIPEWCINYEDIIENLPNFGPLLTGRTIVGGLLGGCIGVLVTKRILGIRERRGNQFAPGIALGMAIGRIGCFLTGCCYGTPTTLFFGVDFGDGILRHPTQLYEALFCFGLFIYLFRQRHYIVQPGMLFRRFMVLYLTFRFFVEFIRVGHLMLWGLTGYQLACIVGIIYVYRDVWLKLGAKTLGREA
jgi:phosphatidylglycerol:prolipoprotein diacylglycerol transferase